MTKSSVAILYGFGEGERHSRNLRNALETAHFDIATNPENADIIIAHSGGMYSLPKETVGKTIFIIAPSCGQPDNTWLQTQSAKVWQDMKYFLATGSLMQWLQKSAWNAFYLCKQIPTLPKLWRAHHEHLAGLPITNAPTIVVTFKDDPWSGCFTAKESVKHPTYIFIQMNAIHDDIWLHPKPYVELIQRSTVPHA